MKYAIGLNVGISFVSYAVVGLDHDENPWGIIKMGSRTFTRAEQPKTGASLALPRREARSIRRRLRRHKHRLERIKNLLVRMQLVTKDELLGLYKGKLESIYTLRVKALDEPVSNLELSRILLNLAQRRGFKSNRKADSEDKEAGKLLQAVSENKQRMLDKGYRTAGEMLLKDEAFSLCKRNKDGVYLSTVHRDMVADEASLIISKQHLLGNELLTEEFQEQYLAILLSQRQFDEGPGAPSAYAGNQIENMIGQCTFEPAEKRAAKACYSFERFNLLQKVNHLRIIKDGVVVSLNMEQREQIVALAYRKADLKFTHIRKELGLGEDILFNDFIYDKKDIKSVEDKVKFNFLPAYHKIRKALDKIEKDHISKLEVPVLDEIGRILTVYKGDVKREEALAALNLSEAEIEALLSVSGLTKFSHLSLKALRKILPFLEKGMIYNEACAAAGYDFKAQTRQVKTLLLPAKADEMDNITSPVFRRAASQVVKVVNAIIREQGESPSFINLELTKELSQNFDERNKSLKSFKENQTANERLKEEIKTEYHKADPSGLDILKLKLWKEQKGVSPYSQKAMDISRIFEPGYADIDYIIPFSVSFDDSFKNKVLVFAGEKKDKGNQLPLDYLDKKFGEEAVENFKAWVQENIKNYRKKLKLLKVKITKDDLKSFKEYNLQDTKTVSSFLSKYINDYLLFAPSEVGRKKKVMAVSSLITSYFKKRWGINKMKVGSDKDYALDALVAVCVTDKLISDLAFYSECQETKPEAGKIIHKFPYPWEDFRPELMARMSNNPAQALQRLHLLFYSTIDLNTIKPIFVSRMPEHKITGAAHDATVRSCRYFDQGIIVTKTRLANLKLDKNGEIGNYFMPESDLSLYNALKARLREFDNDGKAAFAEPFYKPKADGTQGPLVKSVKLMEKSTLNVAVRQNIGVAKNSEMVRADVFKVEGDGYYLVPIYVPDILKKQLPNKAIVAGKSYADWPEMDDKDFIFSLYPNDLIKVVHKKGLCFSKVKPDSNLPNELSCNEAFVYYKGVNIASGAMGVVLYDNAYTIKGLGAKTLQSLEKYQVDVLGNYIKVGKEKRQSFSRKNKDKTNK